MVRIAVAFGLGIWAARSMNINDVFLGLLVILLFSVEAACMQKKLNFDKSFLLVIVLIAAWFLAGLLRMDCTQQKSVGSIAHYDEQIVRIQGKICDTPTVSAGKSGEWNVRYSVDLTWIHPEENGQMIFPGKGGAFLSVRQQTPVTRGVAGDSVTAVGKVHMLHTYHNPGQPDWAEILAGRGIEARIAVTPGTMIISEKESLFSRLERWRVHVRTRLLEAMPDADASLVTGMLFGGYDGIDHQTVQDFSATGIVHILSVSGAHIALVAGAVFWIMRRLAITEKCSALVACMVMLLYGIICGFSPPVSRSVIMGLIGMAAIGMGRMSQASHALSLAVLGMLIWEPRILFDISFQLSVGCTAGLLFIYPLLSQSLHKVLPAYAISALSTTLSAQLAVLPLLSWYFGFFSLISLVANIVVVPLLEGVILLGLTGVVIAVGFPDISHALFVLASMLTGAAVEINRVLTKFPFGSVALSGMGKGTCFVFYLSLFWFLCASGKEKYSPGAIFTRWPRQTAVAGVLIFSGIFYNALVPGPLSVHFIDVGQGDATLIVTPHRRAILVDAGGAMVSDNNKFDVGERVVVPYLRHYGVNRLDLLILTHNHQDHAGGAAAVANMVGAHQILLHQEEKASQAIMRLQQVTKEEGMRSPDRLEEFMIDGVKVQLFQIGETDGQIAVAGKKMSSSSENERSTVVRAEYGKHSVLLTGDLEGESEKKLIETKMKSSTVLKVGHHGAKRSSKPEFLLRVAPQYAVISVGAGNQFGHPSPETLHRLVEWPLTVFRTDKDGAVVFRSDGNTLWFEKTVN